MCGIVAYLGDKQAWPVLIKGLKRLEYRGDDSSGVAIIEQGVLCVAKKEGKVINLEEYAAQRPIDGSVGIGHTRWATHGAPSDRNAHPHLSPSGKIAIIHNGIIENHASIRAELQGKGYEFKSETDTEVLAFLMEDIKQQLNCSLQDAVRFTLQRAVGAFAIVVLSQDNPEELIAARRSSPLAIGIGKGEYVIGSDVTPILEYTKQVIYPKDDEMVILKKDSIDIRQIQTNEEVPYLIRQLDYDLANIEKGEYEHYMLKEIMEQPSRILDCMRGRLQVEKNRITLGGIREHLDEIANAKRLVLIACGTSYHSALVAKYLFEDICNIPTDVDYASEFRYRNVALNDKSVVIGISQSGETADTIVALEKAKKAGALILGICNVVGSTISRITDAGIYTHVGTEIGVASTKAFTGQLTVLYLLALQIAKEKGTITDCRFNELIRELSTLQYKVEDALRNTDEIKHAAQLCAGAKDMLYLGRGLNFPIALEGALKLKEISYIHSEGYPAAEMKHGPIALVDENLISVFIATADTTYEKTVSNMQEIKARGGKIIAVTNQGDHRLREVCDYTFEVPDTDPMLSPLVNIIPLQLLSYYTAIRKGCNVDQPRNLAKSVTVE